MSRSRALLVMLAAAVVLPMPTASAEVLDLADAQSDVWVQDSEGEGGGWLPTDRQVNVDLVKTRLVHSERVVRLRVDYVELRENRQQRTFGMNLRTPQTRRLAAYVVMNRRHPEGRAFLEHRGSAVECRGLRHSVDYDTHRARVVVPRRCLDSPRWVEFQAAAIMFKGSDFFFDDAHSEGSEWQGWSERVKVG